MKSRRVWSAALALGSGFLVADSSMADVTGPNLLVVGGDTKRLQWLTHHVTSHWPSAQVTTLPAGEPAAVSRLIVERTPDAVILQADFADEGAANIALHDLVQMLQLHCDRRSRSTRARNRTRPQWQPPSRVSIIKRLPSCRRTEFGYPRPVSKGKEPP